MIQNARAAEIKAEGIGRTFGNFAALKNVSIDIGRGEFLTLLGPSGSGKTTFLMILAGFLQPSSGKLFSNGADVTRQPAEQRESGMVFQGYALFPHMSVEGNIAFPLHVRKRPADEIRRRVDEMVDRVGLRGHEKKRPSQLSGGQQQRVALARALVFEPGVLLLDEPFSALDKSLREQMQQEVKRLHQETGTTFVFVTHDQSEALALSSRVAIFNNGELQQLGTPQEVYERPANRFVAEFLGEINLLPISALREEESGATALCEDRPIVVKGARRPVGKDAVLAVRPEHMSLSLQPEDGQNHVQATTTSTTYLGAITKLELETRGGARMTLSMPTQRATETLGRGDTVWLNWPADQGFLLPAAAG
jgi:putative spermidine/putrescine transport system ATP-binding protein